MIIYPLLPRMFFAMFKQFSKSTNIY